MKSFPPGFMMYVVAFVMCGTLSTMTGKMLFQCSSAGRDGVVKHFEKPLFQNTGMFLGMTLCLFVYIGKQWSKKNGNANANGGDAESGHLQATAATGLVSGKVSNQSSNSSRIYFVVAIPALCDFVATYMMNIGLLWCNASVWQMIRGSIVLFTALIRKFVLGKNIANYQWFGVFTVMISLCLIGYSAILGEPATGAGQVEVPMDKKLFGVVLVFFAQMVQASQAVGEEFLLQGLSADPLQLVGLEGLWGLVLCVCICMPVAANISTPGLHEDTIDTIDMIENAPTTIVPMATLYCLVILGFNMFAMKITQVADAVTRSVLDTVRTVFIWIFMTVLHYGFSPAFGEGWNNWCYLQLVGFGVLISGLFTYNRVWELPMFDYEDAKEESKDAASIVAQSPKR